MTKKKIMKLSQGLVLQRYILRLLGCTDFEGIAQYMRDSHLEGYDEENISKFHHALKLRLFDGEHLSKDLLLEYDQNIYRHTLAISENRDQPIQWKYFQYFTLLFVEIYLDKYFTNSKNLLDELNAFVDDFNDPLKNSVINQYDFIAEKYTLPELSKVALWSATGSGKTLLMHLNIKQYLHYATKYGKKDFNKVLLITPNEGLSAQHLSEFGDSNIAAEIFSKSAGSLFSGNEVEIIEISKLSEESGEKTVAVDAFETNNLVLIDEGHRGAAGDEWKRRRDQLSENGFAFEYSATFGQAVSAASGAKKKQLLHEYSKAILFDYSYKFFYNDGYGKDYKILNIKDDSNDVYLNKYLTACLLGFYQQQLIYAENSSNMQHYNLAKPLWVFVGGKVNSVSSKTITKADGTREKIQTSDVITIVRFIADFIKSDQESIQYINQILKNTAGLNDADNRSIFSNSFTYLNGKNSTAENIYTDILEKIFNTNLKGANLFVDNLKGSDGELGLRIGNAESYFGVINVGDEKKLHGLLMDSGVKGMDKDFSNSLFKGINHKDSSINLLIGSKKFTEGWSSWRVSTMGLMNIGKGEGSQIIQLFGRGVRLKGYNLSLKRSSRLDDYQRPNEKTPSYLPTLETLNIFGIKADYMQQFKDYLEEEGLPTNETNFKTIVIPVKKRYNKDQHPINIIQTKTGVAENYKKENIVTLELNETTQHFMITLDWYPKVQMMSSNKSALSLVEQEQSSHTLEEQHLAFVNWDKVYFAIQQYKNERSWYNLAVSKDQLRAIISNNSWYQILIPAEDLAPTSFKKVAIWEEMVISLLKLYTDKFYNTFKSQYLSNHIELAVLQEDHPNFIDEYSIQVADHEVDIIQSVLNFKEQIKNNTSLVTDFQLSQNMFIGFDYSDHLYFPLLYMNQSSLQELVKVSPVQLNKGEMDFVQDLKQYHNTNSEYFQDKQVYLLRNQSRTGIGFLADTKGFYPDFILWQLVGEKQYISFIDPKGVHNIRNILQHPKVELHQTIKTEIQNQLDEPNIFLNSFIISNSSFNDIRYRGAVDETIEMFHNANVYFQMEDKNTYIEKVLKSGMKE